MHDKEIIELFFSRDERALHECAENYSAYLGAIAAGILGNKSDVDECLNDTLYRAWNAIPPASPENLATYLGRITRNIAINRFKERSAKKRGSGQTELVLEELDECIPGNSETEAYTDEMELRCAINDFLKTLRPEMRQVFIRRYWYFKPINDIAKEYRMTSSRVKSMLFRARRELKKYLEKESITV